MEIRGPLYHQPSGRCLAARVRVARTLWERVRGAIPVPPAPGDALLLPNTSWVHGFGMAGPLDVVYLDADYGVVRVVRSLKPWRIAPPGWRARHTLEMAAGGASGISAGDRLSWTPAPAGASPVQPASPMALHVICGHVPDGITLKASASRDGDMVRITYTVRNGLGGPLGDEHIAAADGLGRPLPVTRVGVADPIASGQEATGSIVLKVDTFPAVIVWTWSQGDTRVRADAALTP